MTLSKAQSVSVFLSFGDDDEDINGGDDGDVDGLYQAGLHPLAPWHNVGSAPANCLQLLQ